jgi:hypothetical protein
MERDVWVDFNSVDERGQVQTLQKFAESPGAVVVGAVIRAGDDDGNVCEARVLDVDRHGKVLLALNMGTFKSPVHGSFILSA